MVTSNISVDDGLFNGATGILRYILCDQNQQPMTVYLEFDDTTIGKQTRVRFQQRSQRYSAILPTWTPIVRTKLSFTTTRKQNVKVNVI